MKFILEESNERLTPIAGLALVGKVLEQTSLRKRLDRVYLPGVSMPEISHSDVVFSYIGLLCHGKSDFDDIELYRKDPFFAGAFDLQDVPSSPTLRQRLNMAARVPLCGRIIVEESAHLLKKWRVPLTCVTLGPRGNERKYVTLDIDVSPFDNSHTKKEGVSPTYKGHDGYAPIFAYLGREGYCVNTELRPGSDHCQKGTEEFLANSIRLARQVTPLPLLVRMDAGNDSKDNLRVCLGEETKADFLIKRNLRKEKPEDWLVLARQEGTKTEERPGKVVYRGEKMVAVDGCPRPIRLVYKVTERTILRNGQMLLIPEIEVETYWTTLPDPVDEIIALYHDHGTSEQFHSEIKTDLGLERLPSGKFATNDLVLRLGALAYNILRFIGQLSIGMPNVPIRRKADRRRIRTVMQDLIVIAARMVQHARQLKLKFALQSPWYQTFKSMYMALS